jgi:hypothetical protein
VTDSGDVRASDQDRERAAQEIRDHFAVGRLDEDELNDRVSAAYAARTTGELAAIRADLPALPVSQAELKAAHVERRRHLSRRLVQQTGCGLVTFLILTGIWVAAGASGFFWPIFILLASLVPLLRNGWSLYGPAPELDRVERHLDRQGSRDRDRSHRHDRRHQRRGPPRI